MYDKCLSMQNVDLKRDVAPQSNKTSDEASPALEAAMTGRVSGAVEPAPSAVIGPAPGKKASMAGVPDSVRCIE